MQSNQTRVYKLVLFLTQYLEKVKKYALQRIKLRMANMKVKMLKQQKFQRNSNQSLLNSTNSYDQSNYSSILSMSLFKPLQNNYTSVKILNYQSHNMSKDIKQTYMNRILMSEQQTDNTENFLDLWMNRQQCQITLPQNYPNANYCSNRISQYNNQALQAIKKSKFEHYCKKYIKDRFSFFGNKDPMKFKNTSISNSLLDLDGHEQQTAIQMFQEMLKLGGFESSQQPYIYHAFNIISSLINGPQILKQQAYLQVIKQLSSKVEKYLLLLCCLSATIKVSSRIYMPLLNYIYEASLTEINGHESFYSYAFYHIIKNFNRNKITLPTVFQLYCFSYTKKVPITIALPRQKTFYIQIYTTTQQFIQQTISFYHLDPKIQYILFIDGILLETGYLLDELSRAKKIKTQKYWEQYLFFKGIKAIIVLKNMKRGLDSKKCFNLMYNYYISQYLNGLYRFRAAQVTKIAGLILKSENASEQYGRYIVNVLVPTYALKKVSNQHLQNLKKHILRRYYQFNGTRFQARQEIVGILSSKKQFMTHFFACSLAFNETKQFNCRIGLRWNKLIIVDMNGRTIHKIPFKLISQYGVNEKQLCFKVDRIGSIYCYTQQVEILNSIFQTYIEYGVSRIFN